MTIYKERHVGCYIDGAVPRNSIEIVERLNDLVPPGDAYLLNLDAEEGEQMEEADHAIEKLTEILQKHTEEGLIWHWDAGDLVLCRESELE